MLIQFTVENYRSFRESTTFSLRATADARLTHHVVSGRAGQGSVGVLRAAALYGANGAGKSNLVKAISFAKRLICEGTAPQGTIPFHPFRLSIDAVVRPSRFEFIFFYEEKLYSYGFVVDTRRVHEEWLFVTAGRREVRLFERVTNAQNKTTMEFGHGLRRDVGQEAKEQGLKGHTTRIDNLAADTRENQLFLTACAERNVKALAPIYQWFDSVLEIIHADAQFAPLALFSHFEKDFTRFISEVLKAAGTGISGVKTETMPLDFDRHFPGIAEGDRQGVEETLAQLAAGEGIAFHDEQGRRIAVLRDENGKLQHLSFFTLHQTEQGQTIQFKLEEESDGTQRLFDLVPALFMARRHSKVWIVDELDRRLHPMLTRLLVQTALDCAKELPDAPVGQFIFTTHDTNLLDLSLLRRDEIWFAEKDATGVTQLASLAEWKIDGNKVRPDLDIEKGYLNGRFGAVPLIGDVTRLFCGDGESQAF